jgi:hypothetical protein
MSLTNYSDLTISIASWTARGDYTAANFSDFTTLFEAHANRTLRTYNQETTTTLSTTSGSGSLPSDFLQWRRVTWTGSPRVDLEYVHPSILQAYYPTIPSARPALFTIEGSTLKIRPIDDTGLEFDYWAKIPTLVTNSTNWLMTNWPDIYLAGVLSEADKFNKDPDNMALWQSQRDTLIDELNKSDNRPSGPGAIRVMGYTP